MADGFEQSNDVPVDVVGSPTENPAGGSPTSDSHSAGNIPSTRDSPNSPLDSQPDSAQLSDAQADSTDAAFWMLRRQDQFVFATLLAVTLGLLVIHWARLSGWGMREIEIERLPELEFSYQLDINRATWVEWIQLEGIGETLAKRIVADRAQNGPFDTIEDLDRVDGIGPATIAEIRPWLTVRDPAKQ